MRTVTTAVLVLLFLAACGRKKDWDEEIIVQVFKPQGVQVGTVTVTASQGGKTDKTTVKGFSDCDANRVRVIPKQGSTAELTLKVTAGGAALPVTCPSGIASCGTDCCSVKPPGSSPLKLVLGTETKLEPAGSCTPSVTPPQPDGGPPKLATAEACTVDSACEGGKCLKSIQNQGVPITFPGGYCSQDCSGASCASGETCVQSTNGTATVIGEYCVLVCVSGGTNCTRSGYKCSPLDYCMPE